jgi:hypothetical protein
MCFCVRGNAAMSVLAGNQGGGFRFQHLLWRMLAAIRPYGYMLAFLALICCTMPVSAQVTGPQAFDPYRASPEKRRIAIDVTAERVGDGSRLFLRKYGASGLAALHKCSTEAARRLVELDEQEKLSRIPDPRRLLNLIAVDGDVICYWSVANADLLADPVAFDVFVTQPREYWTEARELRDDTAAAKRQGPTVASNPSFPFTFSSLIKDRESALVAIGIFILVGLFVAKLWANRSLSKEI